MARSNFLDTFRTELDGRYPITTGKGNRQFLIGSVNPGGGLDLSSTSDPEKGDITFGTIVLDEKNNIAGINILDPVPGLGVLQLGGSIRLNSALDPNNVAVILDTMDTSPVGSSYAGKLRILHLPTNEVLEMPVFHAGVVAPPATQQKSLKLKWDIQAAIINPADNFARGSVGTPLALGGSTSSSGHLWTTHGTTDMKTNGVAAIMPSQHLTINAATLAGSVADSVVMCTLGGFSANNTDHGILLRYVPGATPNTTATGWLLFARNLTGDYILWQITGGALGAQNYFLSKAPANGDTIRVAMTGNTFVIDIKASGGSFVNYLNQAVISLNSTATAHGLGCLSNPGSDLITWANFSAT